MNYSMTILRELLAAPSGHGDSIEKHLGARVEGGRRRTRPKVVIDDLKPSLVGCLLEGMISTDHRLRVNLTPTDAFECRAEVTLDRPTV